MMSFAKMFLTFMGYSARRCVKILAPVLGLVVGAESLPAATHTPTTSQQLTDVLAGITVPALALGDTIVLAAGTTYTGTFTLRNLGAGSNYVTIQSSNLASLPAAGTRVNLSHASNMPKIQPANVTSSAIITQPSAHHYKLIGLEVIGPVGDTNGGGNITHPIINLGTSGVNQDTLAEVPNNFIIDRCIVRANTLTQRIKRGIEINTASTDITNCYIADIKAVGQDCQAIMGYNGPGPFNIINNFIQGATENLLFGGTDASIPNLIPSDIVVAKNHFHKPLTWKVGDPSYAGIHWAVKNIFELKNAQRVTVEGNIFENNWTDGQAGYGIVFTPRNQNGTNPWVILKDITFRKNIFRNSAGYNIMGNDNINPSQTTTNVVIENNLNYNISTSFAGNGKLFLISRATDRLAISHNTSFCTGNVIDVDGAANTNFAFASNLSPHNEYGVKGANQSTGNTTLNAFFNGPAGVVFQKNVMMDNSSYTLSQLLSFYSSYPGGWNPTSLAFPQSWTGVVVNQGTPGTDFAGWKVVAGSAYDNSGVDATGTPDGKDIGCNIDEVNAATVGCISGVWAGFLDDFSTNTAGNYTVTGGTINITGGQLKATITTGGTTCNAMLNTAQLAVGQYTSVDVVGSVREPMLMISTTVAPPNNSGPSGIRLNCPSSDKIRIRVYGSGTTPTTDITHTNLPVSGNVKLYLFRDTATSFRYGYDSGSGLQMLGSSVTCSGASGTTNMFIGVQAWNLAANTIVTFDNLRVVAQ